MRRDHFESLEERVEEILSGHDSEGPTVGRLAAGVRFLDEMIAAILRELEEEGFSDQEEEIWFYKEGAPRVWGLRLFYKRLVEIEAWRKTRPPERFAESLRQELKEADGFAERHPICEYYYQGRTDEDEIHFTREGSRENVEGAIGCFLDKNMTPGTFWLAQMRGCEHLRGWLENELGGLEKQDAWKGVLECHASVTEVVELFKGLHELKFFGNIPFNRVMRWVKESFNINTDNYVGLLQNIQRKKGERMYLDKVKEALVKYLNEKR